MELKPCPLCGNDCRHSIADGETAIVECTICGYRVWPDNMHGKAWTAEQSHQNAVLYARVAELEGENELLLLRVAEAERQGVVGSTTTCACGDTLDEQHPVCLGCEPVEEVEELPERCGYCAFLSTVSTPSDIGMLHTWWCDAVGNLAVNPKTPPPGNCPLRKEVKRG